MVTRRQATFTISALAFPCPIFGQQQQKLFRIGVLGAETAAEGARRLSSVNEGLRELGYAEGRNMVLETRWADGRYDRLPALTEELVARKVDVIVVFGTKATLGAKRATSDTPIVMGSAGDIIALGVVQNLAHPGGNVTGSINVGRELGAKRLSLLKEAAPGVDQIAYLVNPANPAFAPNLQAIWEAARELKLTVQPIEIREPKEIEGAFSRAAKNRIGAVLLQDETMFAAHGRTIAQHAAKRRMASVGASGFADSGGLIGYGPDYRALDRRAAYFVDKILKGAKPADLPIEQPTKFRLVVNLRTAKALGIAVPQSIRVVADQVIE